MDDKGYCAFEFEATRIAVTVYYHVTYTVHNNVHTWTLREGDRFFRLLSIFALYTGSLHLSLAFFDLSEKQSGFSCTSPSHIGP